MIIMIKNNTDEIKKITITKIVTIVKVRSSSMKNHVVLR